MEILDLTDDKNRLLYMLTHVATISEEEVRKKDPVYRWFYEECRISNLNEMEKKEYVTSVLEYDDVGVKDVRTRSGESGSTRRRARPLPATPLYSSRSIE